MTTLNQPSARIYQFPLGGRGGLIRRDNAATEPGHAAVVTSSSWYHEAAMLEEQTKKPQ
ncbi:DUF2735 domain-containing protein [Rhodopseudomonas palustris]|uniref:DUF2735 domain-containing protein n=1 Tax=Rhodopseudomonas palustris TaxID=1076 RepID=UPI0009B5ABF3|nr:DUF2735 domain-containing protein [Rhodopseudomonas palustris]